MLDHDCTVLVAPGKKNWVLIIDFWVILKCPGEDRGIFYSTHRPKRQLTLVLLPAMARNWNKSTKHIEIRHWIGKEAYAL